MSASSSKTRERAPRHKGKNVEDFYDIGEELGKGSFAVVKRAVHKSTGEAFAAKIIDTSAVDEKGWAMIEAEIEVLCRINHPNGKRVSN